MLEDYLEVKLLRSEELLKRRVNELTELVETISKQILIKDEEIRGLKSKLTLEHLKVTEFCKTTASLEKKYNNALNDVNNIGLQYSDKVYELSEAMNEIRKLKDENKKLSEENDKYVIRNNELVRKVAELNMKVSNSRPSKELMCENEELRNIIEKIKDKNEELIGKRNEYQHNYLELAKTIRFGLANLKVNSKRIDKENDKLKTKIESLKAMLNSANAAKSNALSDYEKMRKQCEDLTIELKRYESKEVKNDTKPEPLIKESELIINDQYFESFRLLTKRDILLNIVRELLCGNFEMMPNTEDTIVLMINTGTYNIRLIIKINDKLTFQMLSDILIDDEIINLQYGEK